MQPTGNSQVLGHISFALRIEGQAAWFIADLEEKQPQLAEHLVAVMHAKSLDATEAVLKTVGEAQPKIEERAFATLWHNASHGANTIQYGQFWFRLKLTTTSIENKEFLLEMIVNECGKIDPIR